MINRSNIGQRAVVNGYAGTGVVSEVVGGTVSVEFSYGMVHANMNSVALVKDAQWSPFRKIDPVIAAAAAGDKSPRATTAALLKALSEHEGDSDLGMLAALILEIGPYHVRNSEELEAAEDDAGEIVAVAERLADEYTQTIRGILGV